MTQDNSTPNDELAGLQHAIADIQDQLLTVQARLAAIEQKQHQPYGQLTPHRLTSRTSWGSAFFIGFILSTILLRLFFYYTHWDVLSILAICIVAPLFSLYPIHRIIHRWFIPERMRRNFIIYGISWLCPIAFIISILWPPLYSSMP
jgi:hypothetical protein